MKVTQHYNMAENEKNDLEKSIQLAIQAQKDIKQQLLKEISQLKSEPEPHPHHNEATLKFYQSHIHKIISDVTAINSEINKSQSLTIPDMERKLTSLNKKKDRMEERISALQKDRNEDLLKSLNSPQLSEDEASRYFNELIQKLTTDINNLDLQKKTNAEKIKSLRSKLEDIHKNKSSGRREVAMRNWKDEVADEKRINASNMVRRQSCVGLKRKPQIAMAGNLMPRRFSCVDRRALINAKVASNEP